MLRIESGGKMEGKWLYKEKIITVLKGDITTLKTDAIVNAANEQLRGGGGVDGAIHRAGGPQILKECMQYKNCPTGEARLTSAGNMPSRYVIHTVGPIYRGGKSGEKELLENAYRNSLKMAAENNIRSIAFPFISAGVYGYPKDEACAIAVNTVLDFLDSNETIEEVIFCCFSENDARLYIEYLNKKISKGQD